MSKCELFQKIAGQVWDQISRNIKRSYRISELTSTDQLIDTIQTYVEERHSFEVFAQKASDEVNTGADLELYIQSGFNEFFRILLQAKTVELNGNFTSIDRDSGSTGRKQYDSLINYGASVNSATYYLFYNGIPDYHGTFKDCAGAHDERQFGCAIDSASTIKSHCETHKTGTISGRDSSKPIGSPWRFLTCCDNWIANHQGYKKYTREEIDMDPYFKNLFSPPPPIGFIISGQQSRVRRIEMLNRQIHDSGWKPKARVIVGMKRMHLRDGLLRQNW